MRVAIVHYWLIGMRGGERVLEELCSLFPDAVLITHVANRKVMSKKLLKHEIRETFISRLPGAIKHYKKYLPLMPLALEMIDLTEFDLIISSESGPAKGIIPRPDSVHICYCHSPMRYIWDHFHIYRDTAGWLVRGIMPLFAHRLRIWDISTSTRVDQFVANSRFTKQRIHTYYRRDAHVVWPPVAVEQFQILPSSEIGDHYLIAGELVHYKRPDLAIDAFNRLGYPLRVVGGGELLDSLRKISGKNITFLGKISFAQLKIEFASCKALIFPGEEDFGIIPVEVMAAGRPVIAYKRGGALDSVLPGVTGEFFDAQTAESLCEAITVFETSLAHILEPERIRAHAENFSTRMFHERVKACISQAQLDKHSTKGASAPAL